MTTDKKLKRTVPLLNKNKLKEGGMKFGVAIFRYLLLIAISYIILYPLFAMIAYSLQAKADILDTSVTWVPKTGSLENYVVAFKALNYPTAALNTILVGMVSAGMEIISCAIAAYGFARFKFKFRGPLFGLVLFTAIVPVQILIIPLFLNYRFFNFGYVLDLINLFIPAESELSTVSLVDSPLTFWLPSLFGVGLRSGLFIFIYRQFFMGLPKELEEASWIDGCNPLMTFFRVVIPSSGVVFLTVSIFAIIWHWNEYYQSVIFFTNDFPLSVMLSNIRTQQNVPRDAFAAPYVSAACLMFIAPVLVLYLFLQKKFIQSIDRVGIVG